MELTGKDGVEDPIEAEDWVEEHGEVIYPGTFVAKDIA